MQETPAKLRATATIAHSMLELLGDPKALGSRGGPLPDTQQKACGRLAKVLLAR